MSLTEIKSQIRAAESAAAREPDSVTLVAVGKLQPLPRIREVLEQGHRDFGENRIQEAVRKWPDLRQAYPDCRLHLLGPLQSNKVGQAVKLFDVIHSLDRLSIARKIVRVAETVGRCPQLLVQVNTGAEPQKSGIDPLKLEAFLDELQPLDLPVTGLMCIPPVNEEAALHFGLLAELAQTCQLGDLSMGMSADFESAIQLGATYVRVGTAVFGPRDYALR